MSTEQNKFVARSFFEYANHGDMESCLALLADDLVWRGIGTTKFSGTYEGKDAVLADLVAPLFSSLKAGIHTTIEAMIGEGDRVVVQSAGRAETLDGREYNNSYIHIFTVRNGQILEVTEFSDTALIERVFGTAG